MFHHMLVPLDGSLRAEEALPLAAHIARRTGGTLSLVRVVPPEEGAYPSSSRAGVLGDEIHEILTQEAREYLENVSHLDLLADIPLRTQVLAEPPAQSILNYAHTEHADLIVLCSHGYTGLKRWALGSVAQKIARHSSIPVVILPEKSLSSPLYHPDAARPLHALVALDGSPFAEATLLPTAQLLTLMSPEPEQEGELHLLRVIKPPSNAEEHRSLKYDLDLQKYSYREAENYLQATRDRITQEFAAAMKLQITYSVEEESDIAATLINAAKTGCGTTADRADLIALATHGRGGIKRWMVGSITERVLEEVRLPLLMVRPQGPAA